jgi:receptor protein-tyrosine kinase
MSLVEKAANRLEQLRKAGQDVSGELAYPAAPAAGPSASAGESVIERAARALETSPEIPLQPQAHDPEDATVEPIHEEQGWMLSREDAKVIDASVATDEDLAADLLRTTPGMAYSPLGERRSRTIEIDSERLAANGLLTPDLPSSRLANELRVIKRPLVNNCRGDGASTVVNANRIMVTSAVPGEGKSFVSVNIALSIAMERDSTVLLVEADPTRPSIGQLLGVKSERGLMDLLTNPSLDVADVMLRTNIGRLSFIPVGQRHSHAAELLASAAMEQLVAQLASRYSDRILIFDTPPLLAAPEPRALARFMGQVVFVVEADQTPQSSVMEALGTIETCPVVFTVLNKSTAREEGNYYYYG